MRAITLTVSLILFAATPASAHFVFIIPDAAGQKATVVFSDKLERDSAVDIGLISGTKLSVRQRDAKEQPVAWTKGEHAYTFDIPGTGARQIAGTTEYGVMQRGGGKPFLLVYHPKAIVGDFSKSESLGDAVPVEILPVRGSGGIRFRVLAQGKPRPNAEVTVIEPGTSESKKVKTDAEGLTPEFQSSGQYGAWALHSEPKSGEFKGKKFDETRRYASLVVTVSPPPAR